MFLDIPALPIVGFLSDPCTYSHHKYLGAPRLCISKKSGAAASMACFYTKTYTPPRPPTHVTKYLL